MECRRAMIWQLKISIEMCDNKRPKPLRFAILPSMILPLFWFCSAFLCAFAVLADLQIPINFNVTGNPR
jgi:hypothetical protein